MSIVKPFRSGEPPSTVTGDGSEHESRLAERYRPYRERRPPGPLLRLSPSRVIYWRAEPDNLCSADEEERRGR